MFTNISINQFTTALHFCHSDHCRNIYGNVGQSYCGPVKQRPIRLAELIYTAGDTKNRQVFLAIATPQ